MIWLTDRLQMAGSLVLKQEVADALRGNNTGLLCRDIVSLHSTFLKADVLHIYDENGVERARGLSNLTSHEAELIARYPDRPIKELLGYQSAGQLVSRNNLAILEDHHLPWEEPENSQSVINS
jgi:glutamate 5-kinase